jgi:hypothetical protein
MTRRALLGLLVALAFVAPVAAQTRSLGLIPQTTLAAAGTYVGEVVRIPAGTLGLALESKFVRAAGGTTTKVYVQTTLDGGTTWVDIACHAFATTTASKVSAVKVNVAVTGGTTPTDATLTDDTVLDGFLGDRIRVKYVVAGTYSGASSLTVVAVAN